MRKFHPRDGVRLNYGLSAFSARKRTGKFEVEWSPKKCRKNTWSPRIFCFHESVICLDCKLMIEQCLSWLTDVVICDIEFLLNRFWIVRIFKDTVYSYRTAIFILYLIFFSYESCILHLFSKDPFVFGLIEDRLCKVLSLQLKPLQYD